MNRTAIALAASALAIILVVGVILILLIRPEAVSALVTFAGTIFGLLTVLVLNLITAKEQTKQIEQVRSQTNGTLSAKDRQIDALNEHLINNGINPKTGQPVAAPVVATFDTVLTGEADDRLTPLSARLAGKHAGPLADAD